MKTPDVVQLLVSLALMGIEIGLLVFFIVLTALSFGDLRRTWKGGVMWTVIALVLGLPATVLGMVYLDMSRFAHGAPPEAAPILKAVACVVAGMIVLATAVVRVMYYHVAVTEWEKVRGEGSSLMLNKVGWKWTGVVAGVGVGTVAAASSLLVFGMLHVGESTQMAQFMRNFPGIGHAPLIVSLPAALGFGLAAAIMEELLFRGGMLGFLCRVTGNRTGLAWLWIILTAALWAFMHYNNTDDPVLKMGQIFLIGIAFGWMARRWGLGASMAGHIMLNVPVVLLAEFLK